MFDRPYFHVPASGRSAMPISWGDSRRESDRKPPFRSAWASTGSLFESSTYGRLCRPYRKAPIREPRRAARPYRGATPPKAGHGGLAGLMAGKLKRNLRLRKSAFSSKKRFEVQPSTGLIFMSRLPKGSLLLGRQIGSRMGASSKARLSRAARPFGGATPQKAGHGGLVRK